MAAATRTWPTVLAERSGAGATMAGVVASVQGLAAPPDSDIWRRFQTSLAELKQLVLDGEEQLSGLLSEEKEAEAEVAEAAGASSLAKAGARRKAERSEIAAVVVGSRASARLSVASSRYRTCSMMGGGGGAHV